MGGWGERRFFFFFFFFKELYIGVFCYSFYYMFVDFSKVFGGFWFIYYMFCGFSNCFLGFFSGVFYVFFLFF